MKTSDLIKKSQAKRGAPGTLKRKVKGKMTLAKARALKNKPGATTLDKKQANFFINMHSDVQEKKGLWYYIKKKKERGEPMNPKGHKDAPTPDEIKKAQGEEMKPPKDPRHNMKVVDRNMSKINKFLQLRKSIVTPKTKKEDVKRADYDMEKVTGPDGKTYFKRKPRKDIHVEITTAADAGIPQDTKNMGPRHVTDRRYSSKRKFPPLLKRFRKYIDGG